MRTVKLFGNGSTEGGGKIELACDIVVSAVEPTFTAKPIFWINSSATWSGKAYFTNENPANPASGDLWVCVGGYSAGKAPILNGENKLLFTVYPVSAMIYSGSAWAKAPAATILDSGKILWEYVLYSYGNQEVVNTGGWNNFILSGSKPKFFEFLSDSIRLGYNWEVNKSSVLLPYYKIGLTHFSGCRIEYSLWQHQTYDNSLSIIVLKDFSTDISTPQAKFELPKTSKSEGEIAKEVQTLYFPKNVVDGRCGISMEATSTSSQGKCEFRLYSLELF